VTERAAPVQPHVLDPSRLDPSRAAAAAPAGTTLSLAVWENASAGTETSAPSRGEAEAESTETPTGAQPEQIGLGPAAGWMGVAGVAGNDYGLRRLGLGAGVAVVALVTVTVVLVPFRADLALASLVLLYLVPVLLSAAAGGVLPALFAAVAADLLVNWFFVPPHRTLAVDTRDDIVALVVYLLVAAAAGLAVDLAAVRARQAQRLATEAARAGELVQIDRLRTALLGAVGHDLRTPLAGIKVAVSSLRQPDVEFSADDRAELFATVEDSTDRLSTVVDNLLAVGRLQAGVLSVEIHPTALDAVAAQAVLATDHRGVQVDVEVPDDLPLAMADAGLLERVVANLVANACAAGSCGGAVVVRGSATGDRAQLAVVDHGPGIPAAARDAAFAPFQRLDDHTGVGLGLGLAIARGFTEVQDGTLIPTDTPGGGLTMTISLPTALPPPCSETPPAAGDGGRR
jgi:two-component system sensor histidine kinase KdpD